jgi:hypothetical protein
VRGVGQDHVALDGRKLVLQLLHQRHERRVEEHQPVFGMIGDVGDLLGKQPRIDGVIDGADAGDAVPGLEMPPGIPGERRDAVAELDAFLLEPLRDFQRALAHLAIVGAVDRTFDRAGDHLRGCRAGSRRVDDAMAQQRPVLHQSEHWASPPKFRFVLKALGGIFCRLRSPRQAQRLVFRVDAAKPVIERRDRRQQHIRMRQQPLARNGSAQNSDRNGAGGARGRKVVLGVPDNGDLRGRDPGEGRERQPGSGSGLWPCPES